MSAFGVTADMLGARLILSEAVCDVGINLAGAHAACAIVVFFSHPRIGMVQQGTGKVGSVSAVRRSRRGRSGAEKVG